MTHLGSLPRISVPRTIPCECFLCRRAESKAKPASAKTACRRQVQANRRIPIPGPATTKSTSPSMSSAIVTRSALTFTAEAYPKDAPYDHRQRYERCTLGRKCDLALQLADVFTYNAANDWYFEDFGYSEIGDADSAKYHPGCESSGK